MEVCKDVLSDRKKSKIRASKIRKTRVSIAASVISYFAFAIVIVCVILVISPADIKIDLELTFFAMGAILFISSIVGAVCGSSAKAKVKREQLLEGKDLRNAKIGATMSYVALGLNVCFVLCFIALCLFIIIAGVWAFSHFLEIFADLAKLFELFGS